MSELESEMGEYRGLCVEAGLVVPRTTYYESEDGQDTCDNCGHAMVEHDYEMAEKCLQPELPNLSELFDLLQGLGMFRHSWTCPVLASGYHEVEASFPTPEVGSFTRPFKLHYGTGKTREIALVRLLMDFKADRNSG